jgi:hypothetical protein
VERGRREEGNAYIYIYIYEGIACSYRLLYMYLICHTAL